jgi:quinoprotein glucose dehydrogenase
MRRTHAAGIVTIAAIALGGAVAAGQRATPLAASGAAAGDWPTYGRDAAGTRFSPLTELTPANVAKLEVAWVYHMKPATAGAEPATGASSYGAAEAPAATVPAGSGASSNQRTGRRGYASSSSTPLVVNGTMYLVTPYNRVAALDPATGQERWVYQLPTGNPSTRGLEYWPGDGQTPPQLVFGTSDSKLRSLDAATGKPNPAFGNAGAVDLDGPEILRGLPGRNGLTSPPLVYKHLVITGGTTQENGW